MSQLVKIVDKLYEHFAAGDVDAMMRRAAPTSW